jgi:aspartate-semialdehyde dehydrogenase
MLIFVLELFLGADFESPPLSLLKMSCVSTGARRFFSTGRNGLALPNVAIAGVTGAVGQEFIRLLEERNFPLNKLKMLASARSIGKKYNFRGEEHVVEELTLENLEDVDIALFR